MNEMANQSTFYVLDLDRCLIDTEKILALYVSAIEEIDARLAEVVLSQKQLVESTGGSFDVYSLVALHMDRVQHDSLDEHFLTTTKVDDVRNDGATELMALLDSINASYGILTYGSKNWQELKLRLADLATVPYLITDQKHKGEVIGNWQKPSKSFAIPLELSSNLSNIGNTMVFDQVVLIDDKLESFIGLPDNSQGYWLHEPVHQVIPSNVKLIRHLRQILEIIASQNTL